jgi:hypothetical protein
MGEPVLSAAEGTDRLNLELPVDDWDSIKEGGRPLRPQMAETKKFAPGSIKHQTPDPKTNQSPHTEAPLIVYPEPAD